MQFKLISLTTLCIVASIVMASPALSSNKQGLATCGTDEPKRVCCASPGENVSLYCRELESDNSQDGEWYEAVLCLVVSRTRSCAVKYTMIMMIEPLSVFSQLRTEEKESASAKLGDSFGGATRAVSWFRANHSSPLHGPCVTAQDTTNALGDEGGEYESGEPTRGRRERGRARTRAAAKRNEAPKKKDRKLMFMGISDDELGLDRFSLSRPF
ncbi:hypothetical protein BJ165DRAFT_1548464 [Panaeolus papilionaceus]|nr:hypothetical protein BJ165DRAFT_1548464 [Panaeolus papilionaceus]